MKVLSVDAPRRRIALTMRLADAQGEPEPARGGHAKAVRTVNAEANRPAPGGGALAEALRRAAEKGAKP